MIRSLIRVTLLPIGCVALASMSASSFASDGVSATFSLAGLPSTITLCRDSAAIAVFNYDAQWGVLIDVDNNTSTGAPIMGVGAEAYLLAHTPTQMLPCTPHEEDLADNLQIDLLLWDSVQNTFVPSSQPAWVTADFDDHSITLGADVVGGLAALDGASIYLAAAQAPYVATLGNTAVPAADLAPAAAVGGPSRTFPAGDVMNCSAPCSPGAVWYPSVDLVGMVTAIGPGDTLFADGFESPDVAFAR
ncbi:hypothetical protein [Dokdonella sp.]|uniref:hypothetical protein n=1 Tax=Dokdonella sp. TaxID=2291710 RepID=UPI0025C58609|nr:hypothetical protein [Dokdonella sp.]MBX3690062.1 hypothetical protein [Dokdonella sp.]